MSIVPKETLIMRVDTQIDRISASEYDGDMASVANLPLQSQGTSSHSPIPITTQNNKSVKDNDVPPPIKPVSKVVS